MELDQRAAELIGRLKIHFKRESRNDSIKLENVYSKMVVSELLREPYSGEQFPGYDNINHDFGFLETAFRSGRPDWKLMLENVKGVYLIVDKSNGKKYVGSAYGAFGIWRRWGCYIGTGHGWNDELTKLIDEKGIEYARRGIVKCCGSGPDHAATFSSFLSTNSPFTNLASALTRGTSR